MFDPFSLVAGVLQLIVLAGGVIGLSGFGKQGRDGAWWLMAAGVALQTLSALGTVVAWISMMFMTSGTLHTHDTYYVINHAGLFQVDMLSLVPGVLATLAGLVFAIGFALAGYRARRRTDRVAELEAIIHAQAAEMRRLGR